MARKHRGRRLSKAQREKLRQERLLAYELRKTPTPNQQKVLTRFGYRTNISSIIAGQIINAIAKNNWQKPDPPPAPDLQL